MNREFLIGFIIGITLISFIMGLILTSGADDENIIVEGKIIHVELVDSEKYSSDLLSITFDNGDTYKVYNNLGHDVDFTVHSKFIIELHKSCPDCYWTIEQIYRVPE